MARRSAKLLRGKTPNLRAEQSIFPVRVISRGWRLPASQRYIKKCCALFSHEIFKNLHE